MLYVILLIGMYKLDYLFQRLKMKVTQKFETIGILRSGISAIAKPHFASCRNIYS